MIKYVIAVLTLCACSSFCPDAPKCHSLTTTENDLLNEALSMGMEMTEYAEDNMLRADQKSAALGWAKEREAIRKLRNGLWRKVLVCDDEVTKDN